MQPGDVRPGPVIAPQPTADDQHYWDAMASGRLLLQRCADCGTMRHPPRPMCGACQSLERETFSGSLTATVLSWIIPRHPPAPAGSEDTALIAAVVENDDGARLVVNLRGFPAGAVLNDARVEIFFVDIGDGAWIPQARPLAEPLSGKGTA